MEDGVYLHKVGQLWTFRVVSSLGTFTGCPISRYQDVAEQAARQAAMNYQLSYRGFCKCKFCRRTR